MKNIDRMMASRIRSGRLFHAYIISGADAEGRNAAADYIARAAVCDEREKAPCGVCRHCRKSEKGIHPDITVVTREKDAREITVDVVRRVRSDAMVMPNEADRSVYIVAEADTMNTAAQNALLKILEEPPAHALFVLPTDNPELLLTTVRSRCEMITLPPEDRREPSPQADAVFEAMLSGNGKDLVRVCAAFEKLEKDETLNAVLCLRRRVLEAAAAGQITGDRLAELTDALDKCEKYLDANLNTGYISGVLMAEFMEK